MLDAVRAQSVQDVPPLDPGFAGQPLGSRQPGWFERRRPGRLEYANPMLITLLRNPAATAVDHGMVDDQVDGGVLRGLLFGIPIGVALWAAIGAVVWLIWS